NSLIKQFSKRREEIEQVAIEMDLHGGKQMQRAALLTRNSKIKANSATCKNMWHEEAEQHDFKPDNHIPEHVKQRNYEEHIQPKSERI
ncbi:relaxase domain-containing protein, partial [Streptomyces galilaeus]